MRLINTTTYELEEFFDKPSTPSYAILSHRWSDHEVSYKEHRKAKQRDSPGFEKILMFCDFARSQQPPYQWVWVDTCCIDKKSSAELSEAINAMYRWYQNASVCFAYLRIVPSRSHGHEEERRDAFLRSEWFLRGWTLQELLAPSQLTFCDQSWEVLGPRTGLADYIEHITGIGKLFLNNTYNPQAASVAVRMSWAAKRQTTRPEDQAYSLLGLFGVNMPQLYGEGKKAFLRLQLEIIKLSDDESIFAWVSNYWAWGMLAPSLEAFKHAGNVWQIPLSPEQRMPYAMTSKDLRLEILGAKRTSEDAERHSGIYIGEKSYTLGLGCYLENVVNANYEYAGAGGTYWGHGPLTIQLERIGSTWQRVHCSYLIDSFGKKECRTLTSLGNQTSIVALDDHFTARVHLLCFSCAYNHK